MLRLMFTVSCNRKLKKFRTAQLRKIFKIGVIMVAVALSTSVVAIWRFEEQTPITGRKRYNIFTSKMVESIIGELEVKVSIYKAFIKSKIRKAC